MIIARLLAYRRVLLSLLMMVEADLQAHGWHGTPHATAPTQDRRVS